MAEHAHHRRGDAGTDGGEAGVAAEPFVKGLKDPNPRVRLIAAWGLGRLNRAETAPAIMPLLADADFLVAHVAGNALVSLDATAECLKAVENPDPGIAVGAGRVLQRLHEPGVVDGLLGKLAGATNPATGALIYRTLCRLYYREADWDGTWWQTRSGSSAGAAS